MFNNVPVIPMMKALRQYCQRYNLPFRLNRWEEIVRCLHHYTIHQSLKN